MNRVLILLTLMWLSVAVCSSFSHVEAFHHPTRQNQLVVQGQVVWLDEKGERVTGQSRSTLSHRQFGFLTTEKKFFRFLPDDALIEMFTDPRVRARDLQISGLSRGQDQIEIISIKSIRDHRLYDIYYFCEVCTITTYSPGPCVCCQQEVELRETLIAAP